MNKVSKQTFYNFDLYLTKEQAANLDFVVFKSIKWLYFCQFFIGVFFPEHIIYFVL